MIVDLPNKHIVYLQSNFLICCVVTEMCASSARKHRQFHGSFHKDSFLRNVELFNHTAMLAQLPERLVLQLFQDLWVRSSQDLLLLTSTSRMQF